MVGTVDDDPDDLPQPYLPGERQELRAVPDGTDLGGHDEKDLGRERQHGHRSIVVARVVVDHHVRVIGLSPSERGKQQVDGDLLRVGRIAAPGEDANPGVGVDRSDVLEGEIGPFRWRAVRQVDEALLGGHFEHGGDVPDPDVGVEEEHAIARLLAERDRHVDRHRCLADAALGGEDADHAALAHHRCVAHLGAHACGIAGQRSSTANEHRLEPIDQGLRRTGLHGVLVALRPVVRRLGAKDQDRRHAAAVVQARVQLLGYLRLLVAVDGGQVDVRAGFVKTNRLEARSTQRGLRGRKLAVRQREQDVGSLHGSLPMQFGVFRTASVSADPPGATMGLRRSTRAPKVLADA